MRRVTVLKAMKRMLMPGVFVAALTALIGRNEEVFIVT